MKKALSLLLVFVMLLSLCACGKNDQQSTDPSTEPIQTTTENTEPQTNETTELTTESTECPHEYKDSVTTEASCTVEGVKTFTCTKCGDSYTEAIEKSEHTYKDATCTAPKTCSTCGATEGSAAGHSWNDATCTAPKTCSTCGATEGSAAGHNYQNGTCTGCGAAEPTATVDGEWFLEGINNDGYEYEKMNLTLGEGTAAIMISYFGKLEYDSQEMLDFILANGYYTDPEEGTTYYYDIMQYNGVYYCSAMYGAEAQGTYTVSGNTITATFTDHWGGTGNLILSKTSESTISFVSADESLFDSVIREVLNNGRVFTKIG